MRNSKTFFFRAPSNLWPDNFYDIPTKKKAEYPNSDRHIFSDDLSMGAFPYIGGRDVSIIKLQQDNKMVASLFMRGNHYSDWKFSIHEFMHMYLKELIHDRQIAFEIYRDENGKFHLTSFPVSSLRYSLLKGKYYQAIPRNPGKYKNMGFYCNIPKDKKRVYFDKNDFFIIKTPKILLKAIPSFMKRSATALSAIKADKFIKFQQTNMSVDKLIYEEDLFRHRIYTNIGRLRMDKQDRMTEYYYLLRLLRFTKFSAAVREDLIRQWNNALKIICKKLNTSENQFIIEHVISSSECSEVEKKLQNREMSFKEVIDRILNKV